MRKVLILGSTGSIGTQALEVIAAAPEQFEVVGIAAGGSDPQAVIAQAKRWGLKGDQVGVAKRSASAVVAEALGEPVRAGEHAAEELVRDIDADVVLNALVGSLGLASTLATLDRGAVLALANKESLVAGGDLVTAKGGDIVPVDSEHSAMAQCLRAGRAADVDRYVLTASGGPFRGRTRSELAGVTPEQALAHPTWSMGPVVTINSATLVNKGLELIEAHLLFDVPADDITVVVHPQSVVHSMVEFVDGSTIAQASPPDMRLPIALGLSWPDRLDPVTPPCDWSAATSWTFEPLDDAAFPAVNLARAAVAASATHPAVYNAANEEAVAAFLSGRAGFGDIVATVERVLAAHDGTPADALTLEHVAEAETWARARAHELLDRR